MIDIDLSILAQIVSILVLMFVLNNMLYKPMRRMLEEREAKMSSIQGDVEKYERNAEQLVDNFNRKLAEARSAGKAAGEKLKQEAREEEHQLLEANNEEAEAKKKQLMAELNAQIDAAKKELSGQTQAFAGEIAQKLLGRAV